jgi:RES domain-containing protein
MPTLWRISNRCDLEGIGGEKADGRWHTAARGKRIVYLSEHPAVALLEVLANLHINPKLFPESYQLIKVITPDDLLIGALSPTALSNIWRDHLAETQAIGDNWLDRRSSALLSVPSVPSPESFNCLLNPLHPDARSLEIEWCKWIKYDQRLFHVSATPTYENLSAVT